MIGNPQWFARRKYGGWGVMPKTWQGWVYTAVAISPLVLIQSLDIFTPTMRMYLTAAWAVLFAADIVHIMIQLPKDERERIHETIAERNALWVIIAVLVCGVGYQTAKAVVLGNTYVIDWFIIAALIAGVVTKAVSNVYLERRG